MIRPVSFYAQKSAGHEAEIVAIGSPAIFWGSLWALPYVGFAWRRKRDWRAGFVLVAFLMQWLPWFVVRRPQFFFYVLPCTPFMVLAITYTASRSRGGTPGAAGTERPGRSRRTPTRAGPPSARNIPTGGSPGRSSWERWRCSSGSGPC